MDEKLKNSELEEEPSKNEEEIRQYGKKKNKENSLNKKTIITLIILFLIGIFIFIGYYTKHKSNNFRNDTRFDASDRRCVILGYGGVGQVTVPILIEKIKFKEYLVIDKKPFKESDLLDFKNEKVNVINKNFYKTEIEEDLMKILKEKDVILDLFTRHHSIGVIRAAARIKNAIYLNAGAENDYITNKETVNEQWIPIKNYRDNDYKKLGPPQSTIVMDAGANPGLVTHFAILGIFHMAQSAIDRGVKDSEKIKDLLKNKDLPKLAEQLKVDAIHISEEDTIEPNDKNKFKNVIYNSWCLPTFLDEFKLPAEIQIGTIDKSYFNKNNGFDIIQESFPPAAITQDNVYLKTAKPFGIFTGRVTPHPETIEIAEIFYSKNHSPTVSFVYRPHKDSRSKVYIPGVMDMEHVIITEKNAGPLKGFEIMGATLISSREDIPLRWYGSVVSSEDGRKIGCKSNPTTLQVGAGFYAHLMLSLKENKKGIFSPHDFDSYKILDIAKEYLGVIYDMDLIYKLKPDMSSLVSTKEEMDKDLEYSY